MFNEIRKQTGYDVIWPQGSVRSSATLDVSFNKLGLKDVLEVCFQGQPLEYTIENKTIVVREKQTSLLDRIKFSIVAIDVKGRVVDKDMAPMIGATIAVNGKQAAQTDVEGNFRTSGIE